jgi:hypothetical protein
MKYIIIILLIIIAVLSLKKCKKETDYKALYELEHQKFDSIKNKKGETIYVEKIIKTEDKALIKKLSDSLFSLKKKGVKTVVTTEQVFTTVHDTISYENPYIYEELNLKFRKEDSLYKLTGTATSNSLQVDTLQIKNKISFRVTDNEVQVINSNPLIKIEGLNSITLKPKKVKRLGIGPYVGYDLINKTPSAGISLSYQLIKL